MRLRYFVIFWFGLIWGAILGPIAGGIVRAAQGTEARRAETENTGSVQDGPVGNADAPLLGQHNTHSGEE